MATFRTAFHHSSYDSTNNYEIMEFTGDARIDSIIAKYVHRRFPQITKEGVLSKIKHKLKSGKQLGQFGHDMGFFKFIRFNPSPGKKGAFSSLIKTHWREKMIDPKDVTSHMVREKMIELEESTEDFLEEFEEYTAFTEDVFEAFIGTTLEVIDSEEPDGVAEAVTYNIVTSFLDTVNIELTREWTGDPISRLKEMLYDPKSRELQEKYGKKDPGWSIAKSIEYRTNEKTGIQTSIIWWYPKGDQKAIERNRVELARGEARSKKLAGKRAATEAIRQLKTTHRYKEQPLYIN